VNGRAEGGQECSRRARVRPALPVIPVDGREDMAVMLARHGRLLREYARHYLGDRATADDVEEVVERTVDVLLAAEHLAHPHGLRHATQQLWRECQRTSQRQDAPDVPVDRRLGPLTEPVRRVLERLGPRSRQTIIRAAEGWTPEQQANAENTSVGTINIRLHRARRRAQQLLEKSEPSASALLLAAPARLRVGMRRFAAWCRRRCTAVGWSGSGDPFTQLTAATILAIGGLASVAPAAPGATAGRVVTTAPRAPMVQPAAARLDTARAQPPPGGSSQRPSGGGDRGQTPADGGAPRNVLDSVLPGDETPEDTQLTTAAAAPNYATTHTIVAMGSGGTCKCTVLFRSTDGGATWTPSQATMPAGAEQLALPPTYPADPRVFIGTSPQSGQSAYVAPGFDDMPVPLPGPAGHLALAAGFDHGDDRAFVAALGVMVSIGVDATPQSVTPLLAYPQWLPGTAVVSTPAAGDSAAVVVLAPPDTMAISDPLAGETQAPAIFACGAGTSCTRRGTPPPQASDLTVAQSGVASAVSWNGGIAVSLDGGDTFSVPALPPGMTVQSTGATASRIWAVLTHGAAAVMWLPAGGGRWTDVTTAQNGLARSLRLIAIPQGPILDLLVGKGLRCSADGGTTWSSRCP